MQGAMGNDNDGWGSLFEIFDDVPASGWALLLIVILLTLWFLYG